VTAVDTPDTTRAEVKADYARRAEAVAAAFSCGSDLARLRAVWDLLAHHGPAATWLVVRDEFLRAVGVGPGLPWRYPSRHTNQKRK